MSARLGKRGVDVFLSRVGHLLLRLKSKLRRVECYLARGWALL
jgi:hypothetical protein